MALIDNLVAYWPLDEASGNAIDAHGANDLTETSGTIASTAGKVGNCRDFEGGDTEHFEIADNADLSTGDIAFTFAAWVNLESKPVGAMNVLSKGAGSHGEYYLWWEAATDLFLFSVFGASGFGSRGDVRASTFGAPSLATWYFVVVRHDPTANEITISVDAGAPNTTGHSAGVFDGTDPFRIGESAFTEYWDGQLDEVGFWKRVLSEAEIDELYNAGNGRDYAYISGGTPATLAGRMSLLGVGR